MAQSISHQVGETSHTRRKWLIKVCGCENADIGKPEGCAFLVSLSNVALYGFYFYFVTAADIRNNVELLELSDSHELCWALKY